MMPQAVRYEGFSLPLSIATPCWMVLPEIRFTEIEFAIVFLASGLGCDLRSLTREADHIIRAGIHADTAAGAELGFDIQVD
jgi:hypothetical protein